jgi:hypothetical protein
MMAGGGDIMATSKTSGGSGGKHARITTRDVRLIERAIRESWDLPEDTRRAMVARLGAVVLDPQSKLRAVLGASKALAGLSRLNLMVVDVAIRAEVHEDLVRRFTELERSQHGAPRPHGVKSN